MQLKHKLELLGCYIFDPDTDNEWIKEMEKIFSILTCIREQKVSFSTYMLKVDVEFLLEWHQELVGEYWNLHQLGCI